jgi:dTDP-4-dehydrorhamnose 3,5-epimerase
MTNKHTTYIDNRGSYTPIQTNIHNIKWDQCSISTNDKKGTFRGMHYQTNPPQTKYIKVVKGSIIDFIYDLNTNQLQYFILDNTNGLLIPNNMAHGFLTLEDNTIVTYMVEGEYNPHSEHSIIWDSIPELNDIITKQLISLNTTLTISDKDKLGK